MSPLFQIAERRKAKLRLAIDGPSGSGKTYSALLIAKGLARGDLAKVAVIDTERSSANLYSDLGAYSTLDFTPPYSPARYMKAIAAAEEEGFEVIVIDSLTHAWSGEGGLLDEVDKIAKATASGNSFAAWKQGTPIQQRLTDAILKSPCHVIVTLRTKTEYVIEENEKGKKAPRKIGLAPDQRKDLEYDYTLVLDLSREHIASASKDRTSLFDSRYEVPSEAMGAELLAWLESGADNGHAPRNVLPAEEEPKPAQLPATVGEIITSEHLATLMDWCKSKGKTLGGLSKWMADKQMYDGPIEDLPLAIYLRIIGNGHAAAEQPSAATTQSREQADRTATPPVEDDTVTQPAPATEPADATDAEFENLPEPGWVNGGDDTEAPEPITGRSEDGKITTPQYTELCALCEQLEATGQKASGWQTIVEVTSGKADRKALTHSQADSVITELRKELATAKARQAKAAESAEEPKPTGRRVAAITEAQIAVLGATWSELHDIGFDEDTLRADLAEIAEGSTSRKQLSKVQATKLIDKHKKLLAETIANARQRSAAAETAA